MFFDPQLSLPEPVALLIHGHVHICVGNRALALNALDLGGRHLAVEIRVFAVTLKVSSPLRHAHYVDRGTQRHVGALAPLFLTEHSPYSFSSAGSQLDAAATGAGSKVTSFALFPTPRARPLKSMLEFQGVDWEVRIPRSRSATSQIGTPSRGPLRASQQLSLPGSFP